MVAHPITAVLIGAGQRGAEAYAPYALRHPDELRFVAVAEPDPQRRARFAAQHHIPPERRYVSWEDLLAEPQMADAALICTQDRLHTAPALAAMRSGYHILLEKPLAPRLEECEQLVATSEATGRQLHVGHVLRYTRHYRLMRELVQSGVLGQIVDVDHRENVSFWHMAHSFVRGNWRNSEQSSPMILAKCCHDLDMLPWVLEQRCRQLSSVGNLLHFRSENAPPGAPERCLDGCPAAETCPYYAPFIYLEMKPFWHNYAETAPHGLARWATRQQVLHPWLIRALSHIYAPMRQIRDYRGWPLSVLTLDPTSEAILEALRTGPYGRCVYHCDNNVVDHQVVSMVFSEGTTVTLTMHGHSHIEHRSTRIEGSRGRLMAEFGNGGGWIRVEEHRSFARRTYDTSPAAGQGHGGGDMGLMAHFVACVRAGGTPPEVLQTAREALESHRLAFAAEESRLTGRLFRFEP